MAAPPFPLAVNREVLIKLRGDLVANATKASCGGSTAPAGAGNGQPAAARPWAGLAQPGVLRFCVEGCAPPPSRLALQEASEAESVLAELPLLVGRDTTPELFQLGPEDVVELGPFGVSEKGGGDALRR